VNSAIVALCSGPRGSGKSLIATYLAIRFGLLKKRPVWSNMPIDYKGLKSRELDIDELYTLDEAINGGVLVLDEAHLFLDSYSFNSTRNKLLSYAFVAVRKRQLNVILTSQSIKMLDSRTRFQVDLEFCCRDSAVTEWGRENKVKRGEYISGAAKDQSGLLTGYTFEERPKYYPFKLHAKKIWGCYPTALEQDPWAAMQKIEIKQSSKVLTNKHPEQDQAIVTDLVHELAEANDEVSTDQFWSIAQSRGIEGDSNSLGKYLRPLNVLKKRRQDGNYYDFRGVDSEE